MNPQGVAACRARITPQATNSYRVIGKIDETEYEIGAVGIACTELNPVWTRGTDTVIP